MNREVESDGFITRTEDLRYGDDHRAPGFQRKDKPYMDGYIDGLSVAIEFLKADEDRQSTLTKIENISRVAKAETAWM